MSVGKRFWKNNHLSVARAAAAVGFRRSDILSVVSESDLVLDVSGGDSFTDLYGSARFRQIVAPKKIALDLGRRLVLLPQTYGPFHSRRNRDTARRLIDGAALAFARDPDSFVQLRGLLGDRFDPDRHRLGVDLAFGMPSREPSELDPNVAEVVAARGRLPLIGLNVSGLVLNRPDEAAKRFGLTCDYPSLMRRLIMRLLDETDARFLIVPHVHAPRGHFESDLDASFALLESLPEKYAREAERRIAVLSAPLDARELKWLISQCDWFCGTRMHATIAAVSTGVPTAALAYSPKTLGVFKTCEAGESVVDLRQGNEEQALEALMDQWRGRIQTALKLASRLPKVRALAGLQLHDIINCAGQDWDRDRVVRC
jgi:polysaccharide pyruvyl transferase WcaK-like protein